VWLAVRGKDESERRLELGEFQMEHSTWNIPVLNEHPCGFSKFLAINACCTVRPLLSVSVYDSELKR